MALLVFTVVGEPEVDIATNPLSKYMQLGSGPLRMGGRDQQLPVQVEAKKSQLGRYTLSFLSSIAVLALWSESWACVLTSESKSKLRFT